MATTAQNITPDGKPVKRSNQDVRAPGEEYYYEELDFPLLVDYCAVNLASAPIAKLIKRGRQVSISLPAISAPRLTALPTEFQVPQTKQSVPVDQQTLIPDRFRPARIIDQAGTVSLGIACGASFATVGGAVVADVPCIVTIASNGVIKWNYAGTGGLLPGSGSGNWPADTSLFVNPVCITFEAESAYNDVSQ